MRWNFGIKPLCIPHPLQIGPQYPRDRWAERAALPRIGRGINFHPTIYTFHLPLAGNTVSFHLALVLTICQQPAFSFHLRFHTGRIRIYENHIHGGMWYIFASILCIYMPPTWLSVNTVNWQPSSQLTSSAVWDNSLPFQIIGDMCGTYMCGICDIWYMWYIFALICIPPTWRSVNTVNWRSGSRRTSSAVWDISLPFQTKPSRTLFPSAYFITSHYINQRWTYTMPHIATCTVH